MDKIKVSSLKTNPDNPRLIRDEKFKKLVNSIVSYPGIMELRPIVIESWENPVILGGNMRHKALLELKYKEIPSTWVKEAKDLSEQEKKAFVILDNVGFGEWDTDVLANEWDASDLKDWGVDLPAMDTPVEEDESTDEPKELDSYIVKYEIVFNNEGEQDKWYTWLKKLRDNYPDFDTVSERIIAHLEENRWI